MSYEVGEPCQYKRNIVQFLLLLLLLLVITTATKNLWGSQDRLETLQGLMAVLGECRSPPGGSTVNML